MLGISFIDFFYVPLVGGPKMIEIIMATRGWTLLVLYLGACLEWFVCLLFFFCVETEVGNELKLLIDMFVKFLHIIVLIAAFQEVNKGCQILCAEGS